jgi:hypothetical protein
MEWAVSSSFAAEAVDAHQVALDAAFHRHRAAGDHGPVGFLHRPPAEGGGELGGDAGGAGHHENAGGVLVQPVHQAGLLALGVAQGGQHHVEMLADPGPALGGQAGRLVQHDQLLIPVQDHPFDLAGEGGVERGRGGRRGGAAGQRWDADSLAGREAGGGLRALAVHAHLAGAAQLVDHALGEAREVAAEPAVEADIGLVGGDFSGADGHVPRSWRRRAQ